MQRFSGRLAVITAALAGYVAGSWSPGIVHAAKDTGRELLQLDREFDAATAKEGAEGWTSYFAPDGIMMPTGNNLVVGQPAIRDFVSKSFSSPGFSMRWEPVEAGASGDLGYTYGVSKVVRNGAKGAPVTSYGKYVTIWRKQRDRSWKIAIDIGNASPAPNAKTD